MSGPASRSPIDTDHPGSPQTMSCGVGMWPGAPAAPGPLPSGGEPTTCEAPDEMVGSASASGCGRLSVKAAAAGPGGVAAPPPPPAAVGGRAGPGGVAAPPPAPTGMAGTGGPGGVAPPPSPPTRVPGMGAPGGVAPPPPPPPAAGGRPGPGGVAPPPPPPMRVAGTGLPVDGSSRRGDAAAGTNHRTSEGTDRAGAHLQGRPAGDVPSRR